MPGSSTPTLRDMVKDALDRGQTLDQLAERAVDPVTGETASRGHFFDLSKDNVNRMPTAGRLRAVAVALGKPYEAVRAAAIAQWLPADESSAEAERAEIVQTARRLQEVADELLGRVESQGGAGSKPETA